MAASTKTMLQIVTRGHQRLGLLRKNETLKADEAQIGLDMLNSMMHNWRNFNVDTAHVDKVLADLFPLDAKYDEGVACMLAMKLADENGDQVGPQVAGSAGECWTSLLNQYLPVATQATLESALIILPSQRILASTFSV